MTGPLSFPAARAIGILSRAAAVDRAFARDPVTDRVFASPALAEIHPALGRSAEDILEAVAPSLRALDAATWPALPFEVGGYPAASKAFRRVRDELLAGPAELAESMRLIRAARLDGVGSPAAELRRANDMALEWAERVRAEAVRQVDLFAGAMGIALPRAGGRPCDEHANWLLAARPGLDCPVPRARHAEIAARRMDALRAYPALSSLLRQPGPTATIDSGLPLADEMRRGFAAAPSVLRAARDAGRWTVGGALPRDVGPVVRAAAALGMAPERAAAAVRALASDPCAPDRGWAANWRSVENRRAAWAPFAPDAAAGLARAEAGESAVNRGRARDAEAAFRRLVLDPAWAAAAAFARSGTVDPSPPLADDATRAFPALGPAVARAFEAGATPASWAAAMHRQFAVAMDVCLVGRRRPPRVAEALRRFHAFLASAEALAGAARANAPGWQPVCEPWSGEVAGPCGAWAAVRVVPLSTTAQLVEEGLRLNHCVGGYDGACRTGRTHILSVRDAAGASLATVELRAARSASRPNVLSLSVVQFRGRDDGPAPPLARDALEAFWSRLTEGAVRVFHRETLSAMEAAARSSGHAAADPDLDAQVEAARGVWRLARRTLLPGDVPPSFDAFADTLLRRVAACAALPRPEIDALGPEAPAFRDPSRAAVAEPSAGADAAALLPWAA